MRNMFFVIFMQQVSSKSEFLTADLRTCNFVYCFIDRASRYNRVKKTDLKDNLFLVYFVDLYMFRAYLGPSSGGTTVCVQQFVLIILFRCLSFPIQPGQQSSKKNNKYELLYIYGCTF
jgi:hypothetical protein